MKPPKFGKTLKRPTFGAPVLPPTVYKHKFRQAQFPQKKVELAPTARAPRPPILAKRVPTGPYFVQGYRASDLEWRTYRMLLKLGWTNREIRFQVDFMGGRMPGGQVLDFVVWSFSGPIVIPVNGDYWHARTLQLKQVDDQKAAYVKARFPQARYFPLYSSDLKDDETAFRNLMRIVGRG